jgi:hypothetical protein
VERLTQLIYFALVHALADCTPAPSSQNPPACAHAPYMRHQQLHVEHACVCVSCTVLTRGSLPVLAALQGRRRAHA